MMAKPDTFRRGVLDYPLYLALLQRSGFTGALILHGLAEEDVTSCLAFVRAVAPEGLWSATSSSPQDRRQ